MRLTPAQRDRALGAVIGTPAGDALGAGYEFGSATVGPDGPAMIGGGLGGFAPGEWTDDTTMAWCILDIAATGADLRTPEALTGIATHFTQWYASHPPDIGNQTRAILASVATDPTGAAMTSATRALHERTGRTAGNGSLMRTAPVALPYLDDPDALVEAARVVGALTHYDSRAQEACMLWSLAIRHAILHAELDVRSALVYLDDTAAAYWTDRLDEAENSRSSEFSPNGWAVTALQAAWSAIVHTPVPGTDPECAHLTASLDSAIAIGPDTDTVAALAGALLGARYGASATPAHWRRILHGYPGIPGERLIELAELTVGGGQPGAHGWPRAARIDYTSWQSRPTLAPHPHDDGVWLADASALDNLPEEIDAVVSLCLLGTEQVPNHVEHIRYRLIDEPDPDVNPNLDFILTDAATTIAALRDEGKTVLLHCVAAQSRTPAVAVAYAMRLGIPYDKANREVVNALPAASVNAGFRAALQRL